jgi:hypothetical protein
MDAQNAVESHSECEIPTSARVVELGDEEWTRAQQLRKSALNDTVPEPKLEPELNAEKPHECKYCALTIRVVEQNMIEYCK